MSMLHFHHSLMNNPLLATRIGQEKYDLYPPTKRCLFVLSANIDSIVENWNQWLCLPMKSSSFLCLFLDMFHMCTWLLLKAQTVIQMINLLWQAVKSSVPTLVLDSTQTCYWISQLHPMISTSSTNILLDLLFGKTTVVKSSYITPMRYPGMPMHFWGCSIIGFVAWTSDNHLEWQRRIIPPKHWRTGQISLIQKCKCALP